MYTTYLPGQCGYYAVVVDIGTDQVRKGLEEIVNQQTPSRYHIGVATVNACSSNTLHAYGFMLMSSAHTQLRWRIVLFRLIITIVHCVW